MAPAQHTAAVCAPTAPTALTAPAAAALDKTLPPGDHRESARLFLAAVDYRASSVRAGAS